jgi:phage terminase large subunit GpA-like protein
MVDCDPGDLLWYMQTEPSLDSYVKRRIEPMIAAHKPVKQKLGTRPIDNSLHFKRFTSMSAEFLTATSANLINKSAPRIVADEIDAYPAELGDVLNLLNVRRQTFGRESKVLGISHPDRAGGLDARRWNDGIMAWYAQSDRRTWWAPCPHCGQHASFAPTDSRHFALDYPIEAPLDVIEAEARLICPANGCRIADDERRGMNLRGAWVGLGQAIDEDGQVAGALLPRAIAGFWITGTMSPFAFGGLGGLAAARVKAQRAWEATGDDASLRQVLVKQWGLPYDGPKAIGSIDATALADRSEAFPLGQVPEGVRFLTAFLDVQDNRFELLVRGFGIDGESWIVDFRRIEATPAISAEDWDRAIALAIEAEYPLADGSGRIMRVRGASFDSGGAPGVTEQAYGAWLRWKKKRVVRRLGNVAGRDIWSLLPAKGQGGANAPKLLVSYPDTARKDRRAAARGEVPIAFFNANVFKDALAAQLGQALPGRLYVHVPDALRSPEPPHVWFEQLVAERRKPNGTWEKLTPRNEALDLMVGTHMVAHLHGLARLDWVRPPAWAAPWEMNSSVGRRGRAGDAGCLQSGRQAGANLCMTGARCRWSACRRRRCRPGCCRRRRPCRR